MDAYAFISKVDDESFGVVQELSRFSVRTAGCFAAYAAFSGQTTQELGEVAERIAAAVPGEVELVVATNEVKTMSTGGSPGWPGRCIDPETGAVDYQCLGSPEPSVGYKFASFAAAEIVADRGMREELHARLTLTGNVIGLGRLLDPSRLLVEVGNPDRDLVLRTLDEISAMPEVTKTRAGIATQPIERPSTSD